MRRLFHDLSIVRVENGWIQARVDSFFAKLYQVLPNRTVTGGTVDLLGESNAAPSGVLQASATPSTGKEYVYALLNDPNGKARTSITTA